MSSLWLLLWLGGSHSTVLLSRSLSLTLLNPNYHPLSVSNLASYTRTIQSPDLKYLSFTWNGSLSFNSRRDDEGNGAENETRRVRFGLDYWPLCFLIVFFFLLPRFCAVLYRFFWSRRAELQSWIGGCRWFHRRSSDCPGSYLSILFSSLYNRVNFCL